jgi:hypothetical protein
MGNPLASLVIVVVFVTAVTLVAMVTRGIPSHPDKSDVTGAIRKTQGSNPIDRARTVTLRVGLHVLTC